MAWVFDTNLPIYQSIVAKIEYSVLCGEYKPGQQLPTVRELATVAGVNPNTVQKAYAELETSGLINNQRTAGRFVTADAAQIEVRRAAVANQHVSTYFLKMQEIGYAKKQALDIINKDTVTGGA